MALKLFNKTTGEEFKSGDVYGIAIFDYVYNHRTIVMKDNVGTFKIGVPKNHDTLEIREVYEPTPAYRNSPIFLDVPVNPGEPTRIIMTANELRIGVPGVKPFEFKDATVTPNPEFYAPLDIAIMRLIDAGYSVKGVRDHDRTGFRSIQAKKKDKTTLIAHIEIIGGMRYVRNGIFNMINGD